MNAHGPDRSADPAALRGRESGRDLAASDHQSSTIHPHSSLTPCRLLIDAPAPGPWNMAVDEVLMEWSAATGGCALRFYRWREPTLSLGYFQAYEDRKRHAASLDCAVVRRTSGGGAILHDAELTYSFTLARKGRLAFDRLALYRIAHATLIEVLAQRGIAASLSKGSNERTRGGQPFLCFERRAPGDVLVGQAKIAGSAQRRSPGAVLQHGSVLLERSPAAPELDGLVDLTQTPIEAEYLVDAWQSKLGRRLALTWEDGPLSGPEQQRAGELVEEKFAAAPWTRRR